MARTIVPTVNHPAAALAVSEKQFQQSLIDLARLSGWLVYHTHESRHSPSGFPDLTLVRDGALIFAELKTDTGRVTEAQTTWLAALGAVTHVEAAVWRPADWAEIERRLLPVVNSSKQGVFGAR